MQMCEWASVQSDARRIILTSEACTGTRAVCEEFMFYKLITYTTADYEKSILFPCLEIIWVYLNNPFHATMQVLSKDRDSRIHNKK